MNATVMSIAPNFKAHKTKKIKCNTNDKKTNEANPKTINPLGLTMSNPIKLQNKS